MCETLFWKIIIPIVPPYDNNTPAEVIKYGFPINIIRIEKAILVHISFLLYVNWAKIDIIPMIPALTTDGEKFVINI